VRKQDSQKTIPSFYLRISNHSSIRLFRICRINAGGQVFGFFGESFWSAYKFTLIKIREIDTAFRSWLNMWGILLRHHLGFRNTGNFYR
jgi:hypothetical protein